MDSYLQATTIIDWQQPDVLKLAKELAADSALNTAKRCFEWVRDEIRHSADFKMNPVTCRASDVLQAGTGFCYAKSHLLAAVLRANGIPAGLCYQRLTLDETGTTFCLHGLNAVYLPDYGWYRIDARGNKPGVDAQFIPPVEQLAFQIVAEGEANLDGIWSEPLPQVVQALHTYATFQELLDHLPDVE